MKMYVISDNHDTLTGMRLCGIEGVRANDRDAVSLIDEAVENSDVGILLVTSRVYNAARDRIDELKLTRRTPLIVAIPDGFGGKSNVDFIGEYVREAIGVKMKPSQKD